VSNASELPDYITFSWPEPKTISAVRIISGWFNKGQAGDPISRFELQRHQGSDWVDIEGVRITRRGRVELVSTFPAVKSDRIRLVVTGTPGNISRIWEIEFYNPAAD